jgi:hypothetical protein
MHIDLDIEKNSTTQAYSLIYHFSEFLSIVAVMDAGDAPVYVPPSSEAAGNANNRAGHDSLSGSDAHMAKADVPVQLGFSLV